MFLGTFPVSVTSGKRTAIPSIFRKDLGEKLILARWYEECLVLINEDSWAALYKKLTGGEEIIVGPIRDTERFILGSAYRISTDDQGRIVVPERLSNYAHLGDTVYFIGLGERIEIWDRQIWEEKEKSVARDAASYLEELAKNK
jgi:MraZ protein